MCSSDPGLGASLGRLGGRLALGGGRLGGRLALVDGRPGGRPRPAGRPTCSGWGPAWAGWEAGQPGSASFFLSLTIFWDLLLVIFSFVLDLLLLIFSTPLWVVIKVDPEYAQGTGMK